MIVIYITSSLKDNGGSDFHGSAKPDVSLGTGKNNNLYIRKLSILDRLK